MDNLTAIFTGLTIGLAGSLHCVGMCGPLVMGFTAKNETAGFNGLLHAFKYSAGRIVTYSLMGLAIGIFGEGVKLTGYQGIISIMTGVILLLTLIVPKIFGVRFNSASLSGMLLGLKGKLSSILTGKGKPKPFTFGMLNGFLPCGFVYTALAASLVPGDVYSSVLVMAAFGVGTSPLLSALFLGSSIGKIFPGFSFSKVAPYMTIAVSVLLILRGLDLGIPFISPQLHNINIHGSNCCSP